MGVDNVQKVLRELHFNAIRWMEKCIDLETAKPVGHVLSVCKKEKTTEVEV